MTCFSQKVEDACFQALMKAYLECKEAAKQTFGHKKPSPQDTID